MSLQFLRLLIEVIKDSFYLIPDELKTIVGTLQLSLAAAQCVESSDLRESL